MPLSQYPELSAGKVIHKPFECLLFVPFVLDQTQGRAAEVQDVDTDPQLQKKAKRLVFSA